MKLALTINSVGLIFDIIGAILMFRNSQAVNFGTYIYTKKELKDLKMKARKMNRMVKLGAIFLFIGFSLQLISNWFTD